MGARGFTLVEVLIALAIVGVALVATLRAGQVGTDGVQGYRDHLLASWLAENTLSERVARREWPNPGETRAEAEMAGRTFLVRQDVQATPNPRFRRLDVRVASPDQPERVLHHVAGFLTAP